MNDLNSREKPNLIAEKIPGRTVHCNDREYLFFSGTSYLGINDNQDFSELLQQGIKRFGSNYGSSRNSNFKLAVFEEAEQKLAGFAGAPAALTVSSGFMAGQLIMNSLNTNQETIFAPGTHPALWRSPKDRHQGSFSNWKKHLNQSIAAIESDSITICCNSLDPLLSIGYDFNWVQDLPRSKSITLIIDDSHGIGVIGKNGTGIYPAIKYPGNVRLIVVASLAKAMGIPGGIIFAENEVINLLRSSPFYSAASPIPPAYLHALINADSIYEKCRNDLKRNVLAFEESTGSSSIFQHLAGYPVFYSPDPGLAPYLEEQSILISSFPYPEPKDPIITRVILNANHTREDLELLHDQITSFKKNY